MNQTNNKTTKVKLLTIKEAAQLIDGLTEYRVRQLCLSGELPCFKAGKKYLINENALLRLVDGAS
jgi:excisionase family DNA binding protein